MAQQEIRYNGTGGWFDATYQIPDSNRTIIMCDGDSNISIGSYVVGTFATNYNLGASTGVITYWMETPPAPY